MARESGKRPWVARLLWASCVVLAVVLALKFFVADVYRISSESMRPTLFGGSARDQKDEFNEYVLVRYEHGPVLERFDLVVIDRQGLPPIVKRVVGLPSESVRVVEGDLFIDGKRLGPSARRPAPIPVFDAALHPVQDPEGFGFDLELSPKGPWVQEDDAWHLRGAQLDTGRDTGRSTGMMFYNPDVRDGYIDQNGKRIAGFRSVNDLVLEVQVSVAHLTDRMRLQLSEAGDLFEARLRPAPDGGAGHVFELIRSFVGSGPGESAGPLESIEASQVLDLPMEEWLSLRFANVDNWVTLNCPELGLALSFNYDENTRFPGKREAEDQNVGARVALGGEGLDARFRGIRVLRDLHYTKLPKAADQEASGASNEDHLTFLGPEELFLLGDNSSQSIDSRSYGALTLSAVIGRPVAVVWPLSRARWLAQED